MANGTGSVSAANLAESIVKFIGGSALLIFLLAGAQEQGRNSARLQSLEKQSEEFVPRAEHEVHWQDIAEIKGDIKDIKEMTEQHIMIDH